jgi:periplasmic divalent cation tolerance protein
MPDQERATTMARALVDEGLAACVNIIPGVRSVYRWDGKTQEDEEVLCLIKTRPELFPETQARILALHPYEVPEVLAFRVDDGNPSYLTWLRKSTRG